MKGSTPLESKVAAIIEAPEPRDVRDSLGLSTLAQPLNHLLYKGVPWACDTRCQEAFKKLKLKLASSEVLVHYDPNLPLRLDCDASLSAYGVGTVLSHQFADGSDRPIAYASQTLSPAE